MWWSDVFFQITAIRLEDGHAPAAGSAGGATAAAAEPASPYPFSARPIETREGTSVDRRAIWVAESTPPVDGSIGHTYKISFTIDQKSIDPDMFIDP